MHTAYSNCISDLAILLRVWDFAHGSGNRRLHRHGLFIDEAQSNHDGINNTYNYHV
jgi:hypothetical protein